MHIAALIRRYPTVIVPFLLWGIFDYGLLFLLLQLSGSTLASFTVPVTRYIGNESVLRFVTYVLSLPRLFSFAKDITGLTIGIIFIGIAVSMISQGLQGIRPDWPFGARKVIRRYYRYAAVGVMMLLFSVVIVRVVGSVHVGQAWRFAQWLLGFLGVAALQMIFVFSIPVLMIENRKIRAALRRSVALTSEYWAETMVLVGIPYALLIPLLYTYSEIDQLAARYSPSIVLYLLAVRILLLAVVNFIVVASATVLLLQRREVERGLAV